MMTQNIRARALLLAASLLFACGAHSASTRVKSDPRAKRSFAPASDNPVPKTDRFGVFNVSRSGKSSRALDELGVGWVRLQLQMGKDKKNFTRVLESGYGLWLTLYHRDGANADQVGTVGVAKSKRGGFPPKDKARYQMLVRSSVLPLVRWLREHGRDPADWLVIQFGNEVLPRDVLPPDSPVRFWHGTGDEYLAILALGYQTIKSMDPDIPVAAAGFSTLSMDAVLEGRQPIVDWNSRILAEGKFDWADIHLRGKVEAIPAKVSWVRQRFKGPIASTEFAGPDIRTGAIYSEELQAKELPARMKLALDAGVDRIYWAQLVDRKYSDEPQFHNEGLITGKWRRKPSYMAYQKFIEEHQIVY